MLASRLRAPQDDRGWLRYNNGGKCKYAIRRTLQQEPLPGSDGIEVGSSIRQAYKAWLDILGPVCVQSVSPALHFLLLLNPFALISILIYKFCRSWRSRMRTLSI